MLFFKLQHTITLLIIFIYIFSYFFYTCAGKLFINSFCSHNKSVYLARRCRPARRIFENYCPPYNVFSPLKKI